MSRKLPITPISQIKGCFRMLSMRAREIHAVRKASGNACSVCGKKQSVAKGHEVKVQVHHTRKPDWDRIVRVVREELLDPRHMVCLCTDCHKAEHEKDESGWKGDYAKTKKPDVLARETNPDDGRATAGSRQENEGNEPLRRGNAPGSPAGGKG